MGHGKHKRRKGKGRGDKGQDVRETKGERVNRNKEKGNSGERNRRDNGRERTRCLGTDEEKK